jgi:hypothetical protein
MFTSILVGLLCYSLFIGVFLVGWHRHCVMTEAYDVEVSKHLNSGKK